MIVPFIVLLVHEENPIKQNQTNSLSLLRLRKKKNTPVENNRFSTLGVVRPSNAMLSTLLLSQ